MCVLVVFFRTNNNSVLGKSAHKFQILFLLLKVIFLGKKLLRVSNQKSVIFFYLILFFYFYFPVLLSFFYLNGIFFYSILIEFFLLSITFEILFEANFGQEI